MTNLKSVPLKNTHTQPDISLRRRDNSRISVCLTIRELPLACSSRQALAKLANSPDPLPSLICLPPSSPIPSLRSLIWSSQALSLAIPKVTLPSAPCSGPYLAVSHAAGNATESCRPWRSEAGWGREEGPAGRGGEEQKNLCGAPSSHQRPPASLPLPSQAWERS